MAFSIKAAISDVKSASFAFTAQETMYGGKLIAEGDTVFNSRVRTRAGKVSSRAAWSRRPN